MREKQSEWLRLAVAIHAAVQCKSVPRNSVALPAIHWEMCQSVARRIQKARQRGWRFAAARLEGDFRSQVRELRDELDALCARLSEPDTLPPFATVRDLYQDLLALSDEFEQATFDRLGHTLSVITEPIELEGIYLGPFEIRLPWNEFAEAGSPRYRVIAVDPHPAASHDSVTHPHVQNEVVCEGDGCGPIRSALEQGRLLDFFLIVAGILRTYNDGSPHVALDEWYGSDCIDCGSRISEHDRWSCERCGDSLCDDCRLNCSGCDGTFCGNDITCCTQCDESYCNGCLPCRQRGESPTCQNCLDEARKDDNREEEESVEKTGERTEAAVQPDGVGQAVVSA